MLSFSIFAMMFLKELFCFLPLDFTGDLASLDPSYMLGLGLVLLTCSRTSPVPKQAFRRLRLYSTSQWQVYLEASSHGDHGGLLPPAMVIEQPSSSQAIRRPEVAFALFRRSGHLCIIAGQERGGGVEGKQTNMATRPLCLNAALAAQQKGIGGGGGRRDGRS